ncbi:MAG: hypothetical protein J0I06_07520 [Planctomycetes bacterium]|nr:hypothetical protein [Planctomycetota bacterium]
MNARTLQRLNLFLLVAALATGCAPLRGTRLDPSTLGSFGSGGSGASNTNPGAGSPAESIPGGTIVAAGGGQPVVPDAQLPPAAPPGALAQPRPLPAPGPPPVPAPPSGWPNAADYQPPVPAPTAGVPGAPQMPPKIDPHVRTVPTAAGGRLALTPYEVPTDRVVELTFHLERLMAENRTLSARIKELETAGLSREQALDEAKREVDAVIADAAKTRAALQTQVAALQGKIKQLEEEDIIFLRAVIEALGRLLPPEKKP